MERGPERDFLFRRGLAMLAVLGFVCLGLASIVLRSWGDLDPETRWLLLALCTLVGGGLVITIRHMVRQTATAPGFGAELPPIDATRLIRVKGLRNPEALRRWCETTLASIATVAATTHDSAELVLDQSLNLKKQSDRELAVSQIRRALELCDEQQATVDEGAAGAAR
jgi:hypothetical protein